MIHLVKLASRIDGAPTKLISIQQKLPIVKQTNETCYQKPWQLHPFLENQKNCWLSGVAIGILSSFLVCLV